MLSIVKTTLAIAVLGSVSLASAQAFAAHRYHSGYHSGYAQPTFQNRNVSLPSTMVPPAEEQWFDRATQSFGGGG